MPDLAPDLDGALHFDGVSTVTLARDATDIVPSGSVYIVPRIIVCESIVIDVGVTVLEKGWQIFCTGEAEINGLLDCSGGDGGAGAGGVGGSGGTPAIPSPAVAIFNATPVGGTGGAGGGGNVGVAPGTWMTGSAGVTAANGNGGTWQGGGGGTGANGAGGATPAPAVTAANAPDFDTLIACLTGRDLAGNRMATGSGGGGGAGGGGEAGGQGGSAGGVVFLQANTIVGSGTLRATGGEGGAAQNEGGHGGGGGGGGGGAVITVTNSVYPLSVTIDVAGGVGGLCDGGPTAHDGGVGGLGVHYQYNLSLAAAVAADPGSDCWGWFDIDVCVGNGDSAGGEVISVVWDESKRFEPIVVTMDITGGDLYVFYKAGNNRFTVYDPVDGWTEFFNERSSLTVDEDDRTIATVLPNGGWWSRDFVLKFIAGVEMELAS